MERGEWQRSSLISRVIERVCTPIYEPNNEYWEVTFKMLGLVRPTIESLWCIFWRINKSQNGHFDILEFLDYFNFDRTLYVEKSFEYFDTTGSDKVDFLEFVISVFSICTFEVDTLPNFAFDLYDLNDNGELSLPDLETLLKEVYGSNLSKDSIGSHVLNDIINFAEVRGGVLTLNSFTIFTANHSLLLLPVFNIQRKIQSKVMGIRFWKNCKRAGQFGNNDRKNLNARQAHLLARRYKKGGVHAMLEYCSNPSNPLIELYRRQHQYYLDGTSATNKEQGEQIITSNSTNQNVKNEKFKIAANKIKMINSENKRKLKELVRGVSMHTVHSINTTSSSMIDGFIRAQRAILVLKNYLNPLRRESTTIETCSSITTNNNDRDNDNLDHSASSGVQYYKKQQGQEAENCSSSDPTTQRLAKEKKQQKTTVKTADKYPWLVSIGDLQRKLQMTEKKLVDMNSNQDPQQNTMSYNQQFVRSRRSVGFDHRLNSSKSRTTRMVGSIVRNPRNDI